jgi:hypothetical protein
VPDLRNEYPCRLKIKFAGLATSGLAPLRGAVMTNDFSGGLRGLRPPATFFATLRVAVRSVDYINAVETVPNLIALSDTGLKPGVNDRSHFQTFEPKQRS